MRSKLDILLNILEILRNKTIRKIKSTTETNETIRQYIYIYREAKDHRFDHR